MLDPNKIPRDLDSAIEHLYSFLTTEDIKCMLSNDSIEVHHGPGRHIRNSWNLWDKETHLVQWFVQNYGICHADDISGLILTGLWKKARLEIFDPKKEVERYYKHWKQYGYDPATMERLDV